MEYSAIPIKATTESNSAFIDTVNEAIVTCNGEQIIKINIRLSSTE